MVLVEQLGFLNENNPQLPVEWWGRPSPEPRDRDRVGAGCAVALSHVSAGDFGPKGDDSSISSSVHLI